MSFMPTSTASPTNPNPSRLFELRHLIYVIIAGLLVFISNAGEVKIQLPGGGERVLTELQLKRYRAETNSEARAVLMLGWQGEICRVHGHVPAKDWLGAERVLTITTYPAKTQKECKVCERSFVE